MSDKIAALQQFINARGVTPPVVVDGQPGPATRAGFIEAFRNRHATPVTAADIALFAARLGGTMRQMATVGAVESGGSGWDNAGLLTCLFERHYAFKRVGFAIPFLSDPKPGGYTVDIDHDGINDSWEKLADLAMKTSAGLALECASFGKFQIMGANWKPLGYRSVVDFVWGMTGSEAAHYEALVRYIEINQMQPAFRAISDDPRDCLAFARGYNGKNQQGYDGRLAQQHRHLA